MPCELWLDACVLHQRTTFQSSQASNLLTFVAKASHSLSTPCHGAWTSASLSSHPFTGWERKISQIESTNLFSKHPFVPTAQQLITSVHLTTTTTEAWRTGQITDGMRSVWKAPHDFALSSPTPAPIFQEWPCQGQLGTGLTAAPCVGLLHSCLHKRGMVPSAACQCGAEQTVDRVVLQCPIHRPSHGLTGLDDKEIDWLLSICPEIYCGQAVDYNNWLKWSMRRALGGQLKMHLAKGIGL